MSEGRERDNLGQQKTERWDIGLVINDMRADSQTRGNDTVGSKAREITSSCIHTSRRTIEPPKWGVPAPVVDSELT
jgi:hypothetical protein